MYCPGLTKLKEKLFTMLSKRGIKLRWKRFSKQKSVRDHVTKVVIPAGNTEHVCAAGWDIGRREGGCLNELDCPSKKKDSTGPFSKCPEIAKVFYL